MPVVPRAGHAEKRAEASAQRKQQTNDKKEQQPQPQQQQGKPQVALTPEEAQKQEQMMRQQAFAMHVQQKIRAGQPLNPQEHQFAMFMQQQMMMQQQQQRVAQAQAQAQAEANMSPAERAAMRRSGVLTEEEVNEGVEDGSRKQGKVFRTFFIGLVICIVLFLMFLKSDAEFNIELPKHAKDLSYKNQGVDSMGRDIDETQAAAAAAASAEGIQDSMVNNLPEEGRKDMEEYLKEMNVNSKAKKVAKPVTADGEDAADADNTVSDEENVDCDQMKSASARQKCKRRERKRFLDALAEVHKKRLDEQQALTTCGRACQDKYGLMQKQFDLANQQIGNELFSVVSKDEDDAEKLREGAAMFNPHTIKKAAQEKISELEAEPTEEGTEAHLDKQLAIQEIKDAEAILSNTESRTYYMMTGMKPPPAMSKVSARDGGWGQNLLLRTHFHKLILTWLQYLESSKLDGFTIFFVFTCLFLGPALARLPQTIAMAQRMAEEWEEAAEMQKEAKNK